MPLAVLKMTRNHSKNYVYVLNLIRKGAKDEVLRKIIGIRLLS